MSNSIITRTRRSWIIQFAIKIRRDNVKKNTESVNEDPIGNESVTSDQLVNAMPGHIFLRTTQMYIVLQIVFIL